jgi:hypothetical protein
LSPLHFSEETFALHLLFQDPESLIDRDVVAGLGLMPRKEDVVLGCLLADLCFGALQKRGNMNDSTPVFDPIAKGEQILLGPFLTGVKARLFGHLIHPNSLALSLASLQAAVRKSARLIETRLSSFLGKLLARS